MRRLGHYLGIQETETHFVRNGLAHNQGGFREQNDHSRKYQTTRAYSGGGPKGPRARNIDLIFRWFWKVLVG